MPKAKLPSKKKVVEEVVQDAVVAPDAIEDVVTIDGEPNADFAPATYVDPFSFVYEVQAGKKYVGFNAQEAVQFAHTMIGKVDKIVISKMK